MECCPEIIRRVCSRVNNIAVSGKDVAEGVVVGLAGGIIFRQDLVMVTCFVVGAGMGFAIVDKEIKRRRSML